MLYVQTFLVGFRIEAPWGYANHTYPYAKTVQYVTYIPIPNFIGEFNFGNSYNR